MIKDKEIAFQTCKINELKKCNDIDILYFGDEFCQNKIPSIKSLKYAFEFVKKNRIKFVFVLPYINDTKIKTVKKILNFLNNLNRTVEIVFNDWGTFNLISGYKNLRPILGRLLNKQRKDPIADKILNNIQPKMKIVIQNGKKVIIQKKQIPNTVKTYFQKTYLDNPEVMNFMLKKNINRYELDLLPWDIKLNLNKNINISIYYPYINISTTRYCGAINLDYTSKCNKICQKHKIILGENSLEYPYVVIGNTIFYKAGGNMLKKSLKNNKINRIVFNDFDALLKFKGIK